MGQWHKAADIFIIDPDTTAPMAMLTLSRGSSTTPPLSQADRRALIEAQKLQGRRREFPSLNPFHVLKSRSPGTSDCDEAAQISTGQPMRVA